MSNSFFLILNHWGNYFRRNLSIFGAFRVFSCLKPGFFYEEKLSYNRDIQIIYFTKKNYFSTTNIIFSLNFLNIRRHNFQEPWQKLKKIYYHKKFKCVQWSASKHTKNIARIAKAALRKSHRLSRCQVVLTKRCHYNYYCHYCHYYYYHNLSFWVMSKFELSFVKIWVFKFCQFLKVLSQFFFFI